MRIWMGLMAAALLLCPGAAVAQDADVLFAGDDGWTTPGGGQSQINLEDYAELVKEALGGDIESETLVSLKGAPLSEELGSVDTIIRRPNDIDISGGEAEGELEIVALNLESEEPVRLADGRVYWLRVCLAQRGSGYVVVRVENEDGGTFGSSFPVLPKLIFTNADDPGDVVTVDCATGACPAIQLASENSGWVRSGGPGGFSPLEKGLTPIRRGIIIDTDCDGAGDTETIGNVGTNFHAGFAAEPDFPVVGVGERHETLGWHVARPVLDCATSVEAKRRTKAAGSGGGGDLCDGSVFEEGKARAKAARKTAPKAAAPKTAKPKQVRGGR